MKKAQNVGSLSNACQARKERLCNRPNPDRVVELSIAIAHQSFHMHKQLDMSGTSALDQPRSRITPKRLYHDHSGFWLLLRPRREVRTNSSHPRLYRAAVHHVISSTSRSQALSSFHIILNTAAARVASPATTTTCCWTPSLVQIGYILYPYFLLSTRNSRLQWHLQ